MSELIRLTNGQPFFTQLLCQCLVECLNETQSRIVDHRVVQQVVKRVVENPVPQLLYEWDSFTDREKVVLSAAATLLKTSQSYFSAEGVSQFLQAVPQMERRLSPTEVRIALEGLRQSSVLDRDQDRFRFTMDLVRRAMTVTLVTTLLDAMRVDRSVQVLTDLP